MLLFSDTMASQRGDREPPHRSTASTTATEPPNTSRPADREREPPRRSFVSQTDDRETSQPLLKAIPSMDFNYDEIDAEDPDPLADMSWIQNIAVFGFSQRSPADPRVKALSKLRQLTEEHGIGDLRFVDYCRALLVFATHSDKKRREKARRRRAAVEGCGASSPQDTEPATVSSSSASGPIRRFLTWPRRRHTSTDQPVVGRFSASSPPPNSRKAILSEPSLSPRAVAATASEETTIHPPSSSVEDESDSASKLSPPTKAQSAPASLPSPTAASETQLPPSDPDLPQVTPDHVQLVYHMLRHAESIYGLPLTMATAPVTSIRKLSGLGITTARNDIPPSDVVHSHFSATTFTPAHYVAVDRNIESVVVCIRGTANLLDSLTDITATHDPIAVRRHGGKSDDLVHGYGHSGVLRSARNLFDLIRHPTLVALRANPTYELLLTGHSLGAAIASVLSLIMRDDPKFPHALAVCIAPPPCLTWELAEETMTTAITVVNGPDIVPRLSLPVLLPFLATARYVADLPQPQRAFVALGLPSAALQWDDLREACERRVESLREKHRGKELFIPGVVFQLVRLPSRRASARSKAVKIMTVCRDEFTTIRGRERGMFVGHAPSSYRSSLYSVLRAMGACQWGKRANIGRLFTWTAGGQSPSRSLDGGSPCSEPVERERENRPTVDKVVRALYDDGLKARQSSNRILNVPKS